MRVEDTYALLFLCIWEEKQILRPHPKFAIHISNFPKLCEQEDIGFSFRPHHPFG
jgi:hypothetical protein